MLPFLKKNNQTGVIVQTRQPDKDKEPSGNEGLMACAEDLLRCIESKDVKGIANALRAAHDICLSGSEDEPAPHSFEAQNIKAAE